MDPNLDRSLDEILAERQSSNKRRGGKQRSNNGGGNGGGRRRERSEYPRDGVKKSFRDDVPRNLDTEWVHDRFENSGDRRQISRQGRSPEPSGDARGSKIRVENIHYELTEDDLEGLFTKIGPVLKLELRYDRAGRSEGTAFVIYESSRDAAQAIREYDGANAAGQPIRLTFMPSGPASRRNPFDTAVVSGRPLAERITAPGGRRGRSLSATRTRELDDEEAARKGIDRYRPGSGSRSPPARSGRRREGGRRPGARRDGGGAGAGGTDGSNNGNSERGSGNGVGGHGRGTRLKKTAEELDAEMADYFGFGQQVNMAPAATITTNGVATAPGEDVDMIE